MSKHFFFLLLNILLVLPATLSAKRISSTHLDSLFSVMEQELYNNPQKIIHLCKEANADHKWSDKDKAKIYYLYASALRMKGDFDGCITTLYDAITLLEESNNPLMKGKIFNLMSKCYCTLNDYTTAIRLNERATNIFKEHNDSLNLASVYNSRGIIHAYLGEYEQSDHFLRMALAINQKKQELKAIAANLNNMAIYKGDVEEKLEYLNEALVINRNLDAKWAIAENLNNMGKQYYYDHKYQEALNVLKQAHYIAQRIEAQGLVCDNYEYSAMVYKALGNYKAALEKQEALHKLSQKIQSVNKLWAIERNVSQKQLMETQYNAEVQHQQYQNRLWNTYMVSAAIVAILLIILAAFTFQRYQRRKKLELMEARMRITQSNHEITELKLQQQKMEMENIQQALENSRKETTDVAVFMQSRNELLEKIQDQIKLCYKMETNEVIPKLKQINAFIKQNQASDKANSTILQIIDQKSQEFIERLTEKHPNLTQGEQHLASLLRVDISTKDIAILTGISPKSINMNRYRLRKALELEPEKDLTTYLKSI